MKARYYLALVFLLGVGRAVASDPAKVTEAVNVVEHGHQDSSATSPAPVGTLIQDGEFVETGKSSRAEMLLPSSSIARMGSNSIFNYSVDSNTINLQSGTILFCKPKEAKQLNMMTAAVTAAIVGTTGFVSVHGTGKSHTYIFGIIEGHASAQANGKSIPVGPGQILEFRPGSPPVVFSFDVPRLVRTSIFFTGFKHPLPNQGEVDSEVSSYLDDERRGFIQPPSHGVDYSGGIPTLTTTAYDSASNACASYQLMGPRVG